ncbi:MAG: hypothetical protein MI974_34040, partial [Chitinophagales bacterium]|nr:hypothetical protein [Chitinophagales bacterium]
VRCTMWDVRWRVYDVGCTMEGVRCGMYDGGCTMWDVRWRVYDVGCRCTVCGFWVSCSKMTCNVY